MPSGTLARLFGLYLCWGSSIPAMKVMVESVPAVAGAGLVFALGGLVLAVPARGRARPARGEVRGAAVVGALLLVGGQGLATVVLRDMTASLVAILAATNALWMAVLGSLAGTRLDRATVVRLLVGFGGVALVLASAPGAATGGAPLAVFGACLTPLLWAAGTVLAVHFVALPTDPFVSGSLQLLVGGALLLALALALGEVAPAAWAGASASSLGASAFLLVFDSLVGFWLYTGLVRSAPLPLVSTYAYVTPVVAAALGVVALGEPVSAGAILGATVVIIAVAGQLRARPAEPAGAAAGAPQG